VSTEQILAVEDFAGLFGASELPLPCRQLIESGDWRHRVLEEGARDAVIIDLLERIEQGNFSKVVPGDRSRWVRGWGENLDAFVQSGGDTAALAPKYIRPRLPLRLRGGFVEAENDAFELAWFRVFQDWLFRTVLAPYPTIYEFGCGSGINVARLAELYPSKRIVGLDWVEPSVRIVDSMRTLKGWNVEGRLFDFFSPDPSVRLAPGSAVLTIGALEQTGDRFGGFIEYLLAQRPALCVFIEPVVEWYEPTNIVDWLAIRIHHARNFWRGFPPMLEKLAAEGRAEIIKRKRAQFGSLLLEGYSQIMWKPR
jgi:hypothetical protein